ncbi:glycosyltransferase family 2 protein [Stutzerimonas zhaodongensis]|uniref:glycosyltransferase family 2 protein n=1 Tax=Stutzerimonas zhaodongensis TaxID=1176257 RepID=UPI0021036EA5|nr:glycosyltransferase family 2 protein [Stutzerimonas zhaodongensis]MCQ2029687.1 glycosyltransferase family 2 protein [Stutzerimonas zhaodongensis]
MPLNVVITMAGRGSRFYAAGYTVPKYEIMAHGRSLFDWSMLSLKNFLTPDARVVFVCLKENDSASYVRQRCDALGLRDVYVIELDQITDGQATSAYMSRECWLPTEPLLIYNIDTYVNPQVLKPDLVRLDSAGWVPCFQVPGEHWSFVELGEDGWAVDLAEKRRISNFASIGLYWFARADSFEQAYERFFADDNNLVRGERYIAPLYRQLISEGKKVSIADLPLDAIHVLGTPAELEAFLALDLSEQLIAAL